MSVSAIKTNDVTYSIVPRDITCIFENLAQEFWKIGYRGGLPCKNTTSSEGLTDLLIFFVSKKVLGAIQRIYEGRDHVAMTDIGLKAFGMPIMVKAHDADDDTFVGTVHMQRPGPNVPFKNVAQKQFTYAFFGKIGHWVYHGTSEALSKAVTDVVAKCFTP